MKRCLLDTSFLIALETEAMDGLDGPAARTLEHLQGARLYVSAVTVAELLEGAEDMDETERALGRYSHLTIGTGAAKRCALNQSRAAQRMGENDAWQAALAQQGGMTLVACDRAFERRPWLDYLDFSKA